MRETAVVWLAPVPAWTGSLLARGRAFGGIMSNVGMSSIMRFEDLLQLWWGNPAQQSILEFLGIRSQGDVRGTEEDDPGFLRILHERLDGTWWEVTWSRLPAGRDSRGGIRCRYLADSLRDAMRCCPGAQIPPETSIDTADDSMVDDELEFPERTCGRRRALAARMDK